MGIWVRLEIVQITGRLKGAGSVNQCPGGLRVKKKNYAVKEWANGGRKYHPKVPFSGENLTKCKWEKKKNDEMLLHGAHTYKET